MPVKPPLNYTDLVDSLGVSLEKKTGVVADVDLKEVQAIRLHL